jgi:hypothetical protein
MCPAIYWFNFVKQVEAKQQDYINIGLITLSFILPVKLSFHILFLSHATHGYDYKVGLAALFSHSVLLVFLALPLYHLSTLGLSQVIKNRMHPTK